MNNQDLTQFDVLNLYKSGSSVYTYKEALDNDYIVIVSNSIQSLQILTEKNNYNIYDVNTFNQLLSDHEPSSLECFFLQKEHILKEEIKLNFVLDLTKLRNSFSKKASNSWVKAKKKLLIEKDYDLLIAQKSLFHSLRILDFAIDIAKNGKITDYNQSNHLWQKIKDLKTWDELHKEFKETYNSKKTILRSLCPK